MVLGSKGFDNWVFPFLSPAFPAQLPLSGDVTDPCISCLQIPGSSDSETATSHRADGMSAMSFNAAQCRVVNLHCMEFSNPGVGL